MKMSRSVAMSQNKISPLKTLTPPETDIAPENAWLMVGILLSFWEGPFSGAMLVLGRVITDHS